MTPRCRVSILVLAGLLLVSCAESEQPEARRREGEPAAPRTTPGPDRRQTPISVPKRVEPRRGDSALQGGTPTIRAPYVPRPDNPYTSNDESNDQPLGHFGTETVSVFSHSSGHYYTLDADLDEKSLSRIYFPKGGWVDFPDCELEDDYTASCDDEEGRTWDFEADAPALDADDESSAEEDEGDEEEDE